MDRLAPKLEGNFRLQYGLTVSVCHIVEINGDDLTPGETQVLTFQMGDTQGNANVDIFTVFTKDMRPTLAGWDYSLPIESMP